MKSPLGWPAHSWRSRIGGSGSTTAWTGAASHAQPFATCVTGAFPRARAPSRCSSFARCGPSLSATSGRGVGRDKVLALYLNAIYLGDGIYGVEQASRHYFGVGASALTTGQMATLVGMTRSPEYYDPFAHPERALEVRNMVLETLADAGVITGAEADRAEGQDLELASPDTDPGASVLRSSYASAAVLRELGRVAPDLEHRPGLNVHTTIDGALQKSGEASLEAQLEAIERGAYGPFEPGDSTSRLEGAAVAIEPSTGAVLAWIGGRDFARSQFDRVQQSRRQIGSLVKPFMVSVALERGYGILDLVSADTVPIRTDEGSWLPADHVTDTLLPLREALVESSNRAAAHLGNALGIESVRNIVLRAGLSGPVPVVPATALGAFEASLLEMTRAYAVFGNGGMRPDVHLIESVEGADGDALWTRAGRASDLRVMDERTAFVVLDALRAVVDRGTGSGARAQGYQGPAAGKTGTTNDGRDAWFIGLTPDVVAGVWIGFDLPREIVRGRGGGALAAPAWGSWMHAAESAPGVSEEGSWIPPVGVQPVRYETSTGEVVSPRCGPRGGVYDSAWVILGRYRVESCREGPLGWIRRAWQSIFSP
jgi:membrane peptidoglycan carboxypeptidase